MRRRGGAERWGRRRRSDGGFWTVPGSSSKITEQNLKGTDVDSDNRRLKYILTKDPPSGQIQLGGNGGLEKVSVKGPVQSFTQEDVNRGAGLVGTGRASPRQLTRRLGSQRFLVGGLIRKQLPVG